MKTIQICSAAERLLATACLTVLCLQASAAQFVEVTGSAGLTNTSVSLKTSSTSRSLVTFSVGGGPASVEGGVLTADLLFSDFDNDVPPQFGGQYSLESVQGLTGYGNGTNVFSGKFLRSYWGGMWGGGDNDPAPPITLTLTGLPPHNYISLRFLLAMIDSWEGESSWFGPDYFNVAVDGRVVFHQTFANYDVSKNSPGDPLPPQQSYYPPPPGVQIIPFQSDWSAPMLGWSTYDQAHGETAYDMGQEPAFQRIPHTNDTLAVQWYASGSGWQGGRPPEVTGGDQDESWGIDNVGVMIDVGTEAEPIIIVQPSSQEILAGTSLNLSVQAAGETPLAYQWKHNGVALSDGGRISGATANRLLITEVNAEDRGNYAVVVSNSHGSTSSVPAVISVLFKSPEITTQPTDQSALSGASVSLRVAATGSLPMTYQWQRNEADLSDSDRISGSKAAILTITTVGIEDVGIYSVLVRNAFGSVTSLSVALDVIIASPRITRQPWSQAAALGSAVSLEVQATGSLPLIYQWQSNGVDLVDGPRVSGSRSSTLQIANLSLSDLGSYSVLVSNALGWVRSASVALTTSSAVLFTSVEASQLVVWWNDAGKGMVLQRATSLANPKWEDVTGSDRTNRVTLPMTSSNQFLRLFRPLLAGLIAWWPGDGDARDLVGTNHGTLMNGARFAEGMVGQAFYFDGIDDFVSIPNSPEVNFHDNTPMTLELWAYRTSENSPAHLVGKRPGCSDPIQYQMAYDWKGVGFGGGIKSERMIWTGIDPPLNQWMHYAATFNGIVMSFYINGALIVTANGFLGAETTAPLEIGRAGDCEVFQGLIDEVSLYNRALPAAEIKAIYEAGKAGKAKPSH